MKSVAGACDDDKEWHLVQSARRRVGGQRRGFDVPVAHCGVSVPLRCGTRRAFIQDAVCPSGRRAETCSDRQAMVLRTWGVWRRGLRGSAAAGESGPGRQSCRDHRLPVNATSSLDAQLTVDTSTPAYSNFAVSGETACRLRSLSLPLGPKSLDRVSDCPAPPINGLSARPLSAPCTLHSQMAALLESLSAELTSLGEELQELYLHVQHAPISFILILILTTVVGFAGLVSSHSASMPIPERNC